MPVKYSLRFGRFLDGKMDGFDFVVKADIPKAQHEVQIGTNSLIEQNNYVL